jgi:lipoprotein-releasing system permease protein
MVFDFFVKYLFSSRAGALVKTISWLSLIGLTVSISALVVVISVMTALNHNIEDRTLAVQPHLTVLIPGINSGALLELHPLVAKLKQNPDLRVSVFEQQDVILRTLDGHFRGGIARGLTQNSLDRLLGEMEKLRQNHKSASEREPLPIEILAPQEILIGTDLAVSLGVFEGDSMMVVPPEALLLPPTEAPKFERVIVKKIISTNLADVDSQNIFYIRDHSLRSLNKAQSHQTGVEVWMPHSSDAESLKAELASFPEAQIQTWKEKDSALFLALRLEKLAITLFMSLAVLLAGFALISVLVLLVSQKRKEIGLLQTIGFSKKKVKSLFFQIGLCLSGLGIFAGVCIGTGLSYWIELHPLNLLPDIYYDSQIPAYVDIQFVLIVIGVGFIMALIGSSVSSRDAANILPSEAIRKH